LEGALPSYFNLIPNSRSGPRDPSPYPAAEEIEQVAPSVKALPSLWPCFRDTDFLSYGTLGGRSKLIPYYSNGAFSSENRVLAPNVPDYPFGGITFPTTPLYAKIESSVAGVKFYFSEADYPDPTNPATYDYTATTSATFPADIPFPAGGTYYMTLVNEGASSVTIALKTQAFRDYPDYHPGTKPVLFPHEESGRGALELYSYNFPLTKHDPSLPFRRTETPLLGQCVHRVS
jgi:hypothetical protein